MSGNDSQPAIVYPTQLFDDARSFVACLDELRSMSRESRQQFLVPQQDVPQRYPEAILKEEITFPRLLGGFIYRGQSNSGWGLVPSVFRSGNLQRLNDGLPAKANWDHPFWYPALAKAEFQLASAFSWLAQEIGLESPHRVGKFDRFLLQLSVSKPQQEMASYLDDVCDLSNPAFGEIGDDLAVAQHHGIPTRLLDWTEDPFIAAYFATREPSNENGLAVFALGTTDFFYPDSETAITAAMSLVRAPRARELFIQRQKGLFTIMRKPLTLHREHDFDMLKYLSTIKPGKKHGSEIRKIVLNPRAHEELRKMLHERGYRFHTIFPSLSGIKDSILETQQLFGRGQHEHVQFDRGDAVRIVATGTRFTVEKKVIPDSSEQA